MPWKIRGASLSLNHTLLMGILNLTPDSFSDGGKYLDPQRAIARGHEMVAAGAEILDLGGESTRPGASPVNADEELRRLLPVLEGLIQNTQVPLSIDTTKPEVARACLAKGAHIINDVSGLSDSGSEMADLIRETGAGIVLMHRRGNPETMQSHAEYHDVVSEVREELAERAAFAEAQGISHEQIVIDPGLGFAKTAEQTIEILKHLESFQNLGYPILLGASRKSFLAKIAGEELKDRDIATAALAAIAVMQGIEILRVHDIRTTRGAVRMAESVKCLPAGRGGDHHVRTF